MTGSGAWTSRWKRRLRCASDRTSGTPPRCPAPASRRSRSPTARTACASSPTRATTSASPAACPPPASPPRARWAPPSTPSSCAGSGRRSARRRARRASTWSSAPASTSSARPCAGATSSTSPRTRSSPACSARRSSRVCRARASARRSSTTRPTTRRPTGCASRPTSTSARCARSTSPASSASSRRRGRGRSCAPTTRSTAPTRREHHWLLTEVLRDEWGFDGLVMSDWGAVHDRVAALAAGLDLEMPPNLGVSDAAIVAAVRAGELDEALLDQAVARVLQLVDRAPADTGPDFDADAHHALARSIAAECAVLLKNRRRAPAAGAGRRRHDRGDRRVRPHPALPGRRQLAGQPDPRRRRPRRAARGGAGGRGGGVRRRVGSTNGASSSPPGRARGRATPSSPSSASPAPTSPRASTAPTWTCPPTSAR